MDTLCGDLQAIILDKVQKNNEMTLAFYIQYNSECDCLLYVKRNMLDPPNHLTLYIYQKGDEEDEYKLIPIMVRNEQTLDSFIQHIVEINWDDSVFMGQDMRTCYIQGDFSVPKKIEFNHNTGHFVRGDCWGLTCLDMIDSEEIEFVKLLTDFITKKIKGLISVA